MDVGTHVVGARHAQNRAERLAVEEQDALVALRTAGRYSWTIAEPSPFVVKMSTIARAFWSAVESASTPKPPAPSSGLMTALPPTSAANARSVAVRGHHRLRYERGKLKRVELLVGVAQPARIVDEQRLAARVLEHQRRVEVLRIERRVFADEHRVERIEGKSTGAPSSTEKGAADANPPGARANLAVVSHRSRQFGMKILVPAALPAAERAKVVSLSGIMLSTGSMM